MNDLMINGIDHSKFDLEWAKRGGVIFDAVYEQIYIFVNKIDEEQIRLVYSSRLRGEIDFLSKSLISSLRMATPSECAEAGVEYIEPMHAEIDSLKAQLAEARKDSERLDWVTTSCNDYGFDIGANNTVINRLYWIDNVGEIARGKTPREAIDNAMLNGEQNVI